MRRFALILFPILASAQPQRLTLPEAVDLALKNNPRVDAARLDALASAETPTQIRSNFYPQLSANLAGSAAPDATRIAMQALQNPTQLSKLGAGLTVSQLVTDFGRTSKLAESAAFLNKADQQTARATRTQIVLQVNQAYFAALRAQAIHQVAEKTLSTRQTILDQVNALAENRIRSELDVRFAQVSVEEARLLLTQVVNERQSADADLAVAMGLRAPQRFELVEPDAGDTNNLDPAHWIDEAIRQNPEAEQRRYVLEAALSRVVAEKRAYYPTISAMASAGVVPAHSNLWVRDNWAAVGFNIGLPVFTGKLLSSRKAEAELRAESARKTLSDAENRIARDISVALLGIQNAQERVRVSQQLVERSQQALDLARARYDLGLSSIVEFTQAQLALINSEIQLSAARYDVELQRAILSFHAGTTP